jgi:hypothetical protein
MLGEGKKRIYLGIHPGITTMFLVGAAMRMQYWVSGEAFSEEGIADYLFAAKAAILLVTAVLLLVAWWAVRKVWGGLLAALVLLFWIADPFLSAHAQLAHLDALQAHLILLAVVFLLCWWRQGRTLFWVLSAVAAGLALLTKFTSVLIVIWAALVMGGAAWRRRAGLQQIFLEWSRKFAGWLFLMLLTFILGWPGTWLSGRHWTEIWTSLRDAFFERQLALEGADTSWFYLRALAVHLPPPVLLLILVGIWYAWRKKFLRGEVLLLLLMVAIFAGGLSLATKKADRYLLSAFGALDWIAAWGALALLVSLRPFHRLVWGAVLAGTLFLPLVPWTPHLLAYQSPLATALQPLSQQGWGEGLEDAVAWLNSLPGAERMQIATWYAKVVRPRFVGETFTLSSHADPRIDYVVLYRNMAGRAGDHPASNILDYYRQRVPLKVFYLRGRPFVWIYRTDSVDIFETHTGELLAGMEVGQSFRAERERLDGFDVVLVNFSSRQNRGLVVFHLRESPQSPRDLRRVIVSAEEVEDNAWLPIRFAPLEESKGKQYYLAITAPQGKRGETIGVRFTTDDLLPGELYLRRRQLREGESGQDFRREGDLAYRLHYASPPPIEFPPLPR